LESNRVDCSTPICWSCSSNGGTCATLNELGDNLEPPPTWKFFHCKKIIHTLTQVFGSIAKSLYIQFRSKIILLIRIIHTWSNRISLILPRIYTFKKLTSVPQIHTCNPILVQVEDVKTIGQNVFVFDSIEQALNICHVCAYTYYYHYL
jgi:hypothetical protein